jgi:hypothetical protein
MTNLVEGTVTITKKNRKNKPIEVNKFSYITNIHLNKKNLADIVELGRARWQIENCQFNVMKNQGYNLAHNFGHGKKILAAVFVCLAILAFNFYVL